MGHLSRASALAGQMADRGFKTRIVGDVDDHAQSFARLHNVPVTVERSREAEVVVMDAVDVEEPARDFLLGYPVRVLVSPIFRQASIATHVLVRDAPRHLLDSLSQDAKLKIDARFGFVTAHGARPIVDEFADLRVGLCLTAGRSAHAGAILACLSSVDELWQIAAIVDADAPESDAAGTILRHTTRTDDPWGFLAGVNVFVGGDGLMVNEAVARALPTFSVTTNERLGKNRALLRAGAIEPVLMDSFECTRLQRRVVDRGRLRRLHEAAKAFCHPTISLALSRALERICHGRQ